MIRVVVDTNVFVSSFFGGIPRTVIDAWKAKKIILCLSEPMVEEYVAVLQRLGVASKPEIEELLQLFAEGHNTLFASKLPKLKIVEKDPDDDKFIECAVALRCRFIVSGDKHLKAVGRYMGIEILSPREFVERIAAES